MKLIKRILSTLLAVTLMLGTLAAVFTFNVAAETRVPSITPASQKKETDYTTKKYDTPEKKLETMDWVYTDDSGRYSLYVDAFSGEVACLDNATKQILFSNPYDIPSTVTGVNANKTKYELLSQIVVSYCKIGDDETTKTMNSFANAALDGQIKVQAIKKGVRVEYIIGKENSTQLLPKLILEEDFEAGILGPVREAWERGELDPDPEQNDFKFQQFTNAWVKKDVNAEKDFVRVELVNNTYKFLKDLGVKNEEGTIVYPVFYEINGQVNNTDLLKFEDIIKKFTEYSYDQLEIDHARTGYEVTEEVLPSFKMALEYYADENGMTVRLPGNGIRYDMTKYRLKGVTVLPFIGSGNFTQDGYAFFPDGSGALFDYERMRQSAVTVSAQVYGEDYAYHELQNMKYEKVIRYPVYGMISTEVMHTYVNKNGKEVTVTNTKQTADKIRESLLKEGIEDPQITTTEYKRGFLAVIESADSLTEIHLRSGGLGGRSHKYVAFENTFNLRPSDVYDLSSTGGGTITVDLDRKYTGSILIRYTMLCDDAIAAEAKKENRDLVTYPTTWLGMATAYREYLNRNGVLSALEASDIKEDIPLYLESFGALETQTTIATIPVYVMTPLTTFGNVLEMYNSLAKNDIKNVNFKMTGFANGGMYYEVPSALNWENAVGGKDGFRDLVNQATEINKKTDGSHLGLYPDFDFAYIQTDKLFDAVSLNDDAVKTIDNRYTAYRQYSPTQQTFVSFYQLAISPSRYSKFYTELLKNYETYGLKSISVASLGSALNSDFDEEDPYNREDSKEFTKQALSYMKNKGYSIMTAGGNAYTWAYSDHILGVDLDSSRYLESSASVPFIGVVLHGSIQFAGTPLNEEGDANYAMLRAIENGAGMYFLLSYQNTAELKNDDVLSQYYSIRYQIWEEDVIEYYTELNNALKDVQDKLIIGHEFLKGERVLDLDELQASIQEKLEAAERDEQKAEFDRNNLMLNSVADAWNLLYTAEDRLSDILADILANNARIQKAEQAIGFDFTGLITTMNAAAAEKDAAENAVKPLKDTLKDLTSDKNGANRALDKAKTAVNDAKTALDAVKADPNATEDAKKQAQDTYDAAVAAKDEKQAAYDAIDAQCNDAQAAVDAAQDVADAADDAFKAARSAVVNRVKEINIAVHDLIDARVALDALFAEAEAIEAAIPEAIALVQSTPVFEENEEMRDKFLSQMNGYLADITAGNYYAQIDTAYAQYRSKLDLEAADSMLAAAVANLDKIFKENLYGVADLEGLTSACKNDILDADMIAAIIEEKTAVPENKDELPTVEADDTQWIDNNRIVAVTYGTGNTAFKTFILNYNSYAVRVTYGNESYTIASGEYIVIDYPAANQ